jgi:hypothetical protein
LPDEAAFNIHPEAKRAFDEKAHLLAASLTPDPQVFDDTHRIPVAPYVAITITKDEIVSEANVWRRVDHSGRETARYFQIADRVFALHGENYVAFRRLAENMQRTEALRDKVSEETIIDLLTAWLRATRQGASQMTATEFVLSKCPEMVSDYTVLIPLYDLFIEEPFEIGRILIRTVTEQEIDGWVAAWTKAHPEHAESFQKSGMKWKRNFQGKAAASMTVVAEPKRAYEVARREAEDALAMLQVFSIAMLVPEARCYWTLRGSERVESYSYLLLQEGHLKDGHEGFYRYRHTVGTISKALLAELKSRGLDAASALLRSDKRSEFQERMMEALLLYSRAAVQDGLSEKLLYILVALESLLVRDETEPIQQNLAERLAFTVGSNLAVRKAIIKATKRAYGLRSGFMHHGTEIDDVRAMEEFMLHAFAFFATALGAVDQFPTRIAFLDALEARKLS